MDSLDSAIIEVLRKDGRIANVALAERVGLTPGPCLRRVQRLEADGIIVGYQAQNTLGRQLVDGHSTVRIFNEVIRVNAAIHTVGGLSAHADQGGLLNWYSHFKARPPVCLVHGEDLARETLAKELRARYGCDATLARPGQERAI